MYQQILVTGGAGYIGSHFVRKLGELKYDVVIYDNCSTGTEDAVLYGKLIKADLGDIETLYQTFANYNFDTVLHFAASTKVPESIVHPLNYYTNNTRNTLNLLRCCEVFKVKNFVFSSTAAVYGHSKEKQVSESSFTNPINPYGRSKLMSEWMIQDYGLTSNLKYIILRYFNVAGADPSGRIGQFSQNATHLIKAACISAIRNQPLKIFGNDFPTPDGTGIRDYIHVEDLADAHIDALNYLRAGGESQILNCGYGRGYSVREVVEKVKEISQVDFPVIEVDRRPGDPACVIASAKKILQVLDWKPKYKDLDTIVKTSLTWEKYLESYYFNKNKAN